MKIFIGCSKHFYSFIPNIKTKLESKGHEIILPGSFEEPMAEERYKAMSKEEHIAWKGMMIAKHHPTILPVDAVLILNLEKNGKLNYIGGATFLEVYKAWELKKKIFFYNALPDNIFTDELIGMNPTVINQDLSLIQ